MVKFGIQPKKISTALQLLYFVEKGQLAPASMMVFDTKNLDRKNFLATVDRLVCPVPGTPNLLVGDGAVICVLEKNFLICPTSKHKSKATPVSRNLRCRCVRMERRCGSFFDLCKKIFFLQPNAAGWSYPASRIFLDRKVWLSTQKMVIPSIR